MSMKATAQAPASRSQNTRTALIECAESLFGAHGVEGVSLRQIGAASGSANTGVVAYHFGTKQALLQAVIEHRLPAIEARRRELFARAETSGRALDLRDLMEILYLPFFEQVDAAGQHSYAAFMGALFRADLIEVRQALSADYPVTRDVAQRITALLDPGAAARFHPRIELVSAMIFAAIRRLDHPGLTDAALRFEDVLCTACAALAAPPYQNRS
ncbi:TetR/AcrR family transcriptional regulator [Sphingomonas sp. 37zxx]|uniref:TetR/AcrR family transcriptional regulator n=1 Tax=Sphingomonas sp. 37zxx TaxID=1550073 RepID=UPI00068CB38A|nr:TetR family transcriptional regulator [Sphingomonas sp. 37zxx]